MKLQQMCDNMAELKSYNNDSKRLMKIFTCILTFIYLFHLLIYVQKEKLLNGSFLKISLLWCFSTHPLAQSLSSLCSSSSVALIKNSNRVQLAAERWKRKDKKFYASAEN